MKSEQNRNTLSNLVFKTILINLTAKNNCGDGISKLNEYCASRKCYD